MISKIVNSQAIEHPEEISIQFIKKEKEQNPEKIYLNVVKVINNSAKEQKLKLNVTPPAGWSLINALSELTLKPGQSKPIPIRISVSKESLSGIDYKVAIAILDMKDQLLSSDTSSIKLLSKSDWTMLVEEKEFFFKEDSSIINFPILLSNKGNVQEHINVKLEARNQIFVKGFKNEIAIHQVKLAPQQDTLMHVFVQCKNEYKRANFNSSVRITASNGSADINDLVVVSRLNHYYDNYQQSNSPFQTSIRINNPHKKNQLKTQLFSRGTINLKEEQRINYAVTLADINDKQYMAENNNYDILYETSATKLGYGDASSEYTKHVNFGNSLYATYESQLDTANTLSSFISYNPIDNQTAAVAGHKYAMGKNTATTALSRTRDDQFGIFTNAASSYGKYSLSKNNRIEYNVNVLSQENEARGKLKESGYAHTLSYTGKLMNNIGIQASNSYGTSKYPGSERGLFLLRTLLSYVFPQTRYSLQAATSKSSTNPILYDQAMNELPSIRRDISSYSLSLKSPIKRQFSFSIGPDYSETKANNSAFNETNENDLAIRTYSMRANCSGSLKHYNYTGSFKLGISDNDYSQQQTSDIDLMTKIENQTSGVMFKYVSGIKGAGNGTSAIEENTLSISPFFRKKFLNNINLDLSSSYKYNFGYNSGRALVMARANMALKHNWSLNIYSALDWHVDKLVRFNNASLSSLSINLTKGLGSNTSTDYYGLELCFFKDDNGNGIFDEGESAIENMLSLIERSGTLPKSSEQVLVNSEKVNFKFISLVSNKNGEVKLEHMPEGFYTVKVTALQNLSGYFNFKGNEHEIMLSEETKHYFPYEKAGKIHGKLIIKRDKFSRFGLAKPENIRVVARTKDGKEFSTLTGRNGNYTIFVPQNAAYTVTINNPFGEKFTELRNGVTANLTEDENKEVNFIFKEKGRKIKYN